MVAAHQWKLVGPWYRWDTVPEDPGRLRSSRPVIQKYADSNHVKSFLENPQRSLTYLNEDVTKAGKRKIFLDTHDRFYLVACELHCDAPGFPRVSRDQVCEAGFVIRKRKTEIPDEIRGDVESLLQQMSYQRSRVQKIESKISTSLPSPGIFGVAAVLKQAVKSAKSSALLKHENKLANNRADLQSLIADHAISHRVQGWHSKGNALGAWLDQDDELPQDIEEEIFPLYPLIPDQTDEDHASGHKTIWYGLLPVGSIDRDSFGNAKLDDKSLYEIRCFVRRHKESCKKTNQRADCKGEIFWSRPTESYQLAPHFDLIGTSNRITMIQAPNLIELAEQVNSADFKMGQGLGLGVVSPPDSVMPIEVDSQGDQVGGPSTGLPSICFFAIPLITIVALFLLRLTLPIVVFLFGLWFLLRLKLCILPQISIDLGLELDAGLEGELALEADLDIAVKAKLDLIIDQTGGLQQWFIDEIAKGGVAREDAYRKLARMAIDQSIDFTDSGIEPELIQEIKDGIAANPSLAQESTGTSSLPAPEDRLTYYPTKPLSEVFG